MANILVAEDDPALARALNLKLVNAGFTVRQAANGQEALTILKKQAIDLILLDLIMPVLDGFGVLSFLHEKKSGIPIMVLTNLGQEADLKRAKELGAQQYFVKSQTPIADIITQVKQTLAHEKHQ